MKKLLAKIRKILKDRRTRRLLTRFVSGCAAVIVFVTTYALVLPAITMESQADCGIEEHQHDDACYTEVLTCGLPESEGHSHTDACYRSSSVLVCEEEEHEHSVETGCYDDDGNLVCTKPEHEHVASCYKEERELVCGLEESEGHRHDASCYEKELTCGKEVHVHSTGCYHGKGSNAGNGDVAEEAAVAASTGAASVGAGHDQQTEKIEYSTENAGTGETEAAAAALTTVDNEADSYVPTLDPLYFERVLDNRTSIYYHAVADGEVIEDSTALAYDQWNRIPDNQDTNKHEEEVTLGRDDLLRVYLAYTIPAGSLNATNPIARYRLPGSLHLTDSQVKAINENVNGIADQYVNLETLEITDTEKYNAYLGMEAVEGTRTPDQDVNVYLQDLIKKGRPGQEYISATVKVENVYNEITGDYEGQDLVFTFTPYSIEKNRHEYDQTGQPIKAGKEIKGWLTLDFNMNQVDWDDSSALVVFAAEDRENGISEISQRLVMEATEKDPAEENPSEADSAEKNAGEENTAEESAAEGSTSEENPENQEQEKEDSAAGRTAEDTDQAEKAEDADKAAAEVSEETHPAVEFEETIRIQSGSLRTDIAAAESLPGTSRLTVSVSADACTFPAGTTMVLSTVDDMDAVASALEEAVDARTKGFQAVDISFRNAEGKEIEPLKPIRVTMKSKDIKSAAEDSSVAPLVVHVENRKDTSAEGETPGEAAESDGTSDSEGTAETTDTSSPTSDSQAPVATVIETLEQAGDSGSSSTGSPASNGGSATASDNQNAADTLTFESGSFSVYAIVYTVDFHWEIDGQTYSFSIAGGDAVSLSDVLRILGVVADNHTDSKNAEEETEGDDASDPNTMKALTEASEPAASDMTQFLEEIETVSFSDPSLINVSKVEEPTTTADIIDRFDLEIEYSDNLTKEDIARINAKEFTPLDWALVTLKAFDTEEALTITMKDGEVFTIRVTDARDPLGLDDRTVAFVMRNQSNNNYYSVQSSLNNRDLAGQSVSYSRSGHVEYCSEEASVWLFEYDEVKKAYYISNGYHTDGSTRYIHMYENEDNARITLESSKEDASPVKIEKKEDGTYQLYVETGDARHYLTYNSNFNSFYSHKTDSPDANCNFHFCLPEESGSSASHKATLISAQDTQAGQRLVIYQRVWGKDANNTQVAYYYAISGDGTLEWVESSSDSIYWKGDKNIEWELTDLGNGYYTLSGYNSQGQKVYLVPKSDGIVFTENEEAFAGDPKHLSISLPGRDINGTYTSQIASWDYNANGTYGMEVTGTTTATASTGGSVTYNTTTAISSKDYLNAQEFYFATRDPIVQGELTEVDTVNSKDLGLSIKMYDFTGRTKQGDGNRLGFMSDVLPDDEWMPYELHQGLTQRVLGADGYPVSSEGNKYSLKDIFETPHSGFGASVTSKEANNLFIQSVYNETGFFKYSSFENYAYLNDNGKFSVYEQIGTPYGVDKGSLSHWQKTNKWGETFTFGTPNGYGGWNNEYEGNHDYYKRGNFMPYNRLVTTNGKRTNEYDPDLRPLASDDPRRGEDLYVIENGNGNANYFFGMVMSAKFTQNPGGISDKGDPMVFEFNGDDDLWVYVDNVLLLDMGGVHDAFRGKIDFNTGDIYVNGHVYDINDKTKETNPHTTIKAQFEKAGIFPDGSAWNPARVDEYFTGNTFKDFTTHNFKMFYMERGAGASNLELQFNLPILKESQFRVKKDMPSTQTGNVIQNQYADATFYYEAYVQDKNDPNGPLKKVTRDYLQSKNLRAPYYNDEGKTPVKWKTDSGSETKFELKPGMTAVFPAEDDSLTWYVVEVEPDSGSSNPEENSHMLDLYKVSNSDQDPAVEDGTKSKENTILKRNLVTFQNRPDDSIVNELRITKDIIGTPYSEDDAFEIRIFLEATNGKMVPYSFGEYHQINKDGKYVYYENGVRKLSDTPVLAEHASTNGTIGDFREGDTIVIHGLLEGTDFYVYERTDYPYMAKDDNPAAKTYAFFDTDVEDAYDRTTGENAPEHLTGHMFDPPTNLDNLFVQYNTSSYEQSKAAAGSIIQKKNAKVLVKNKPSNLFFEKKWVLQGGDVEYTPTEDDKDITITAKLRGTKTTTTTTYEEEFTTTTETQYVDDELIPVTLVGQDEGHFIQTGYFSWEGNWENRYNNGQETVLTTVNVRKGSTLWFSVGINGTTAPTYTVTPSGSVTNDSSRKGDYTYHSADSLSGNTTWVRNGANVYKLDNITENTTIKATFDGNITLGNNGIGYCIVEKDSTPNKVPVEVPVTTSTMVPHVETNTETSEKTITLNQANGWHYNLLEDPDAKQGWSYVIDSATVQEQNAEGYNFISTPVVTTDDEGNVTYTCTNEKQSTVSVEKSWDPELPPDLAPNAYVKVELRRYAKLRGAFTVQLKTDVGDNPIPGAKFTLYKVVEDGEDIVVQSDLVTDENGKISIGNLSPGTYYYVQTEAPNGYSMDGHNHQTDTFTVNESTSDVQAKTVTLTNTAQTPVGAFTLILKDNVGRAIPGAKFQLYKNGEEVSGRVYITDADGIVTDNSLEPGTYFLRQFFTPDDYMMSADKDTAELIVDQPGLNSAEWTMTNTCKGKGDVTVTLTRQDNSNPIQGAGFTLYKGNQSIGNGTTNAQGKLIFGSTAKLEVGDYSIVQTSTNTGLVVASPRTFRIEENGDPDQHVQLEITNVKEADKGNITINLYRAQGNITTPASYRSDGKAHQNTDEGQPYDTNTNYKPGDTVTVKITTTGSDAAYCTDYEIDTSNNIHDGTFKSVNFVDNEFIFTFDIPLTPKEATYNLACSASWGYNSLEIEFVNPPLTGTRALMSSLRRLFAPRQTQISNIEESRQEVPVLRGGNTAPLVSEKPDGYIEDSSFEAQKATLQRNTSDPDKNWKHVFDGLEMTDSDGNPYYYYIVETEHNPSHYWVNSYEGNPVKGDEGGTVKIKNMYDTSTTATISGTKEVKNGSGDNYLQGYTFTLTGENSAPMPDGDGNTATSSNEGSFAFGAITYSMAQVKSGVTAVNGIYSKTFTYKVKENVPAPAVTNQETNRGYAIRNGMKYDLTERTVNMTVTYNEADGTMSHSVDPDQTSLKFTNEKLGGLHVTKTIRSAADNDTDFPADGDYSYRVNITTVIDEVTYYVQDTEGTLGTQAPETLLTVSTKTGLSITNLPYGTYTVTEINPGADASIPLYSYEIVDGVSANTSTAQIRTEDENPTAALVNVYVKGAVWTPEVTKLLNGQPYSGTEYTFDLQQVGGDYTDHATTTEPGGQAVFTTIQYHNNQLNGNTGTFTYSITENRTDPIQNIQYDQRTIYARVTVTKTQGQLTAEAKYYSDSACTQELSEALAFDNTELGSLTVTKTVTGEYTAASDDTFPFTLKKGDQFVTATAAGNAYTYTGLSDTDPGYTVKAGESNKLTFEKLPAGTYEVTEGSVSKEGYRITTTYQVNGESIETGTTTVARGDTDAIVITNDYRQVIDISGTKTWKVEGATPNYTDIVLKLERTAKPVTTESDWELVEAAPVWSGNTYTYTGLDKNNDSHVEYEYRVSEVSFKVDGVTYSVGENGIAVPTDDTKPNIKLTQTGNDLVNEELTFVTVAKTWNQAVEWPTGYTVEMTLKADGDVITTTEAINGNINPVTLSEDKKSATWINLPRYNSDGSAAVVYTVEETRIMYEGTEVDKSKFTITGNGELTNGRASYDNTFKTEFSIIKLDSEGMETPLEGASFTVQRINEKVTALSVQGDPINGTTTGKDQIETGTDGKVQFTGLTDGYYIVSETKTPDGYIQTGDGNFYIRIQTGIVQMVEREGTGWKVRENEEKLVFTPAADSEPAIAKVGNDKGAALPYTGGPGTGFFTILGSILILGAGALLWRRRKM